MKKAKMTNADFAKTSQHFKDACVRAEVEPTKRQASKFRRGEGKAHAALKFMKGAK